MGKALQNVMAVVVGLAIIIGAIYSYKACGVDGAVAGLLGLFGSACIAKGLEVETWFI